MTELLIVLLAIGLLGVAVYVLVRSSGKARRAPSTIQTAQPGAHGLVEVTLPIDDADPNRPATRRLVADAAYRALAADPEVATVVVLARGGRELGRVERHAPVTPRPFVDVPPELREHAPRHHDPHVPVETETSGGAQARVRFAEEPSQRQRTLADHFDLPDPVRARIANPEDAVAVVRAILDEADVPIALEGDVIRYDDEVLVVLRTPVHATVDPEHLNAAFLRFQNTYAKRGVVVTAGRLSMHDVRRREALAPALLHAGPDGIQRMADALALGANPLDFLV